MRCAKYKHNVDLMQDGALDAASTAKLQAHLDVCKSCRTYHEQGLKLRQLMLSPQRPQVPSWMHQHILHQCKNHETKRLSVRKRFKLQLVPATLAVMLSLVLGSLIGLNSFQLPIINPHQDSDQMQELSFGESTLVEDAFFGGGGRE